MNDFVVAVARYRYAHLILQSRTRDILKSLLKSSHPEFIKFLRKNPQSVVRKMAPQVLGLLLGAVTVGGALLKRSQQKELVREIAALQEKTKALELKPTSLQPVYSVPMSASRLETMQIRFQQLRAMKQIALDLQTRRNKEEDKRLLDEKVKAENIVDSVRLSVNRAVITVQNQVAAAGLSYQAAEQKVEEAELLQQQAQRREEEEQQALIELEEKEKADEKEREERRTLVKVALEKLAHQIEQPQPIIEPPIVKPSKPKAESKKGKSFQTKKQEEQHAKKRKSVEERQRLEVERRSLEAEQKERERILEQELRAINQLAEKARTEAAEQRKQAESKIQAESQARQLLKQQLAVAREEELAAKHQQQVAEASQAALLERIREENRLKEQQHRSEVERRIARAQAEEVNILVQLSQAQAESQELQAQLESQLQEMNYFGNPGDLRQVVQELQQQNWAMQQEMGEMERRHEHRAEGLQLQLQQSRELLEREVRQEREMNERRGEIARMGSEVERLRSELQQRNSAFESLREQAERNLFVVGNLEGQNLQLQLEQKELSERIRRTIPSVEQRRRLESTLQLIGTQLDFNQDQVLQLLSEEGQFSEELVQQTSANVGRLQALEGQILTRGQFNQKLILFQEVLKQVALAEQELNPQLQASREAQLATKQLREKRREIEELDVKIQKAKEEIEEDFKIEQAGGTGDLGGTLRLIAEELFRFRKKLFTATVAHMLSYFRSQYRSQLILGPNPSPILDLAISLAFPEDEGFLSTCKRLLRLPESVSKRLPNINEQGKVVKLDLDYNGFAVIEYENFAHILSTKQKDAQGCWFEGRVLLSFTNDQKLHLPFVFWRFNNFRIILKKNNTIWIQFYNSDRNHTKEVLVQTIAKLDKNNFFKVAQKYIDKWRSEAMFSYELDFPTKQIGRRFVGYDWSARNSNQSDRIDKQAIGRFNPNTLKKVVLLYDVWTEKDFSRKKKYSEHFILTYDAKISNTKFEPNPLTYEEGELNQYVKSYINQFIRISPPAEVVPRPSRYKTLPTYHLGNEPNKPFSEFEFGLNVTKYTSRPLEIETTVETLSADLFSMLDFYQAKLPKSFPFAALRQGSEEIGWAVIRENVPWKGDTQNVRNIITTWFPDAAAAMADQFDQLQPPYDPLVQRSSPPKEPIHCPYL